MRHPSSLAHRLWGKCSRNLPGTGRAPVGTGRMRLRATRFRITTDGGEYLERDNVQSIAPPPGGELPDQD
eukprot:14596523-Alexandrium_andersonii.AAC.1